MRLTVCSACVRLAKSIAVLVGSVRRLLYFIEGDALGDCLAVDHLFLSYAGLTETSVCHDRFLVDLGVLLLVPYELSEVWRGMLLQANGIVVVLDVAAAVLEELPAEVTWHAIVVALALRADLSHRQARRGEGPDQVMSACQRFVTFFM